MKLTDKRQFPRAQVTFPVDCVTGKAKVHCQAANLGGGGVFIHSTQRLEPDTEILVQFRPAKHLPLIKVKGKVRFHIPGLGSGVEFQSLSESTRQALVRLIHHRTIGRRKDMRVPLVTQLSFDEGQTLALVKDISVGGMFVETRNPPPSGSQIRLRFNLDPESPVVVAVGHVSYVVEKAGMGVQFVEIQQEDQQRIQAYIDRFFASDGAA